MTMGLHEDGEFGYRPLLAALSETLDELVSGEFLNADEVERMSLPVVGRRAADLLAPFAPSGRFEGLSVEHLDVSDAEDRYWHQYRSDHDAQAFGACWAGFLRASSFATLADALDGGRGDGRRQEFFDRLESGVAARMAAAPEPIQLPLAQLVLVKIAKGA